MLFRKRGDGDSGIGGGECLVEEDKVGKPSSTDGFGALKGLEVGLLDT